MANQSDNGISCERNIVTRNNGLLLTFIPPILEFCVLI